MIVIELRHLVLVCLLIALAALWLAPPLAPRLHNKWLAASPVAGLGPALEEAPVGIKEIARVLGVTERTVEFHVGNVLSKLNLASRVEAAVWAKDHGLTDSSA